MVTNSNNNNKNNNMNINPNSQDKMQNSINQVLGCTAHLDPETGSWHEIMNHIIHESARQEGLPNNKDNLTKIKEMCHKKIGHCERECR